MNTVIMLYIFSAVALGNIDAKYSAREWVQRGEYASMEKCMEAASILSVTDRYKCIDTGIPFKK